MNPTQKLIKLLLAILTCLSINAQGTTVGVNHPPQFHGGDAALIGFINDNIMYPLEAAQDRVEGKVVVQFMVKKTGKIDSVRVLRSVREDIDEEAVRVVKMMPSFIPGIQNGETVDMWYAVPVTFKLFGEMMPVLDSNGLQPPTFPGGDEALMRFLKKNVKYPQRASENDTQGRVVVEFVVDKTGKVTDTHVVVPSNKDLNAEAIRLCKSLPDFHPALQNGEPVAQSVFLSLTFNRSEDGTTFSMCEDFQPPMFPGGLRTLMQYLAANFNYPPRAAKGNVQGRVIVQFLVDKTGKVSEATIVKSVDKELDAEAIRVCKSLPDFYPATLDGEPIPTLFNLPVTFKLQQ